MMSSRRKRRRGGPFLMVLVLAAIAAATWWLWPEDRSPSEPPEAGVSDPMAEVSAPDRGDAATRSARLHPQSSPPVATTSPPAAEPAPPPALPPAPQAAATRTPPVATDPPAATPPADTPAPQAPPAAAATPEPTVYDEAAERIRDGDPVGARLLLSQALRGAASGPEAADLRATLTVMNDGMIFGPQVTPGDPFTRLYKIRPGDALSRVVSNEGVKTNWRFVQRVNGIKDPGKLRVGQQIKLVQGPFHAEVDRGGHRIDLWLGEGDDAVYIRSLPVGLGEFDSTPRGSFRVRRGGKMVNPSWTNPRTGERYAADDPENPIGEYWIGLDGIDAHNLQEQGFGIHGTIEPDSIGQDRSMGCVRLADDDIALVYEMLTEGNSIVLVSE
jgi:lipoprotein-anchoring transpeptidase ErfK/SrfK